MSIATVLLPIIDCDRSQALDTQVDLPPWIAHVLAREVFKVSNIECRRGSMMWGLRHRTRKPTQRDGLS
jgi:hypothetical protein